MTGHLHQDLKLFHFSPIESYMCSWVFFCVKTCSKVFVVCHGPVSDVLQGFFMGSELYSGRYTPWMVRDRMLFCMCKNRTIFSCGNVCVLWHPNCGAIKWNMSPVLYCCVYPVEIVYSICTWCIFIIPFTNYILASPFLYVSIPPRLIKGFIPKCVSLYNRMNCKLYFGMGWVLYIQEISMLCYN